MQRTKQLCTAPACSGNCGGTNNGDTINGNTVYGSGNVFIIGQGSASEGWQPAAKLDYPGGKLAMVMA
jgi:hypothetical protein